MAFHGRTGRRRLCHRGQMVLTPPAPVLLPEPQTRGAGGIALGRREPVQGQLMPGGPGCERGFPLPGSISVLSLPAPRIVRPISALLHCSERAGRAAYLTARCLKGRKARTSKLIHTFPTTWPTMNSSEPKANQRKTALSMIEPATPLRKTASMRLCLRSGA